MLYCPRECRGSSFQGPCTETRRPQVARVLSSGSECASGAWSADRPRLQQSYHRVTWLRLRVAFPGAGASSSRLCVGNREASINYILPHFSTQAGAFAAFTRHCVCTLRSALGVLSMHAAFCKWSYVELQVCHLASQVVAVPGVLGTIQRLTRYPSGEMN